MLNQCCVNQDLDACLCVNILDPTGIAPEGTLYFVTVDATSGQRTCEIIDDTGAPAPVTLPDMNCAAT